MPSLQFTQYITTKTSRPWYKPSLFGRSPSSYNQPYPQSLHLPAAPTRAISYRDPTGRTRRLVGHTPRCVVFTVLAPLLSPQSTNDMFSSLELSLSASYATRAAKLHTFTVGFTEICVA